MEYKTLPSFINTKAIAGRVVPGIFAVHGHRDSYNDISHPGSFAKTIAERGGRVKFLWSHDWFSPPIAKVVSIREVTRDELPDTVLERAPDATGGVEIVREYLKNEWAERVFEAVASGACDEMSYGYDPLRFDFSEVDGVSVRNLRENRLWEASDVVFGANDATQAAKLALPPHVLLKHLETFLAATKAGARHSTGDIELINQIAAAALTLGATNVKAVDDKADPSLHVTERRAANLALTLRQRAQDMHLTFGDL